MKSREVKIKVDTEKKDADRIYHFVRGKKVCSFFLICTKILKGSIQSLARTACTQWSRTFLPIPSHAAETDENLPRQRGELFRRLMPSLQACSQYDSLTQVMHNTV